MLEINYKESGDQVIAEAQHDLLSKLGEYKMLGLNVLLLLSGGSALKILESGFDFSVLGSHVKIGVLDERYTDDENFSNYAQLVKSGFIGKAIEAGCREFIDTRVKNGETSSDLRTSFDLALHRWHENNPLGKIVATIGMGDDGHTAGLIPSGNNFEQIFSPTNTRWVEELVVPNQPDGARERVTTTFNFLAMIAYGVMVVMGAGKIKAMKKLANEDGSYLETPARWYRKTAGTIKCYTDCKIDSAVGV